MDAKKSAIFFVSTPFNLFNAIAAAVSECEGMQRTLLYIDQPVGSRDIYADALDTWSQSPFDEVHHFATKSSRKQLQFRLRKQALATIGTIIGKHNNPARVYTGNDRRLEFLYGRHCALKRNPAVRCIYLDDGVMTYVARTMHWPQDSIFEKLLKRLLYGAWYDRERIVAGSRFIDEGIVAFPEFAHRKLAEKPLRKTASAVFVSDEVKNLSLLLAERLHLDTAALPQLKMIQILPHDRELRKYRTYYLRIAGIIRQLATAGISAGVKYHPHQTDDPLGFGAIPSVTVLPPDLAFEAMLPLLDTCTTVCGDVSTVLLTAKWLRPDLRVVSIRNPEDPRQNRILPLFKNLGIELATEDGVAAPEFLLS